MAKKARNRPRSVEKRFFVPKLHLDLIRNRFRSNDLQKIGPFGKDNPSPVLLMNNVKAERLKVIGKNHLKFWIDGKEAIWWNSIKYKSDLEKLIKQGRIDVAMEVDINRYQQRSRVQMIVRDVRATQI